MSFMIMMMMMIMMTMKIVMMVVMMIIIVNISFDCVATNGVQIEYPLQFNL